MVRLGLQRGAGFRLGSARLGRAPRHAYAYAYLRVGVALLGGPREPRGSLRGVGQVRCAPLDVGISKYS